ncbi:hypothetical protein BJX76DRAFT_364388 [Aspergillus varians]
MQVVVIASCFSAISTCLVLLRLFTRFYLINHPGIDDYTITIALLFVWCSYAFVVQEVNHGLGKPRAILSEEDFKLQLKSLWLSIPFYNMSLTLIKAAIVFLYLRVFPTPKFVLAARIVIGVIVTYGLWTLLSSFLNCLPVKSFWDQDVTGSCIPRTFLWYFNAAMNIATDIAILVLPIPVLSHLRIPARQKIGVLFIFATGGFACITSMVRLNYLTAATHTKDLSKDNAPIALWSQIEINSGIICCCLPTLQPLIARLSPRLLGSLTSSGNRPGRYPHTGPSTDPHSTARHLASGKNDKTRRADDGITITQEILMEESYRKGGNEPSDTESQQGLVLEDWRKYHTNN